MKSILFSLLDRINEHFSLQPYLLSLYTALFSTAYFGLFRVGELTKSDHAVKAEDVHVGLNKKKILFILKSSKTHGKYALPQEIKICSTSLTKEPKSKSRDRSEIYCPYEILRNYVIKRSDNNDNSDQFFVHADGSAVTPMQMRIKLMLHLSGFNEKISQHTA